MQFDGNEAILLQEIVSPGWRTEQTDDGSPYFDNHQPVTLEFDLGGEFVLSDIAVWASDQSRLGDDAKRLELAFYRGGAWANADDQVVVLDRPIPVNDGGQTLSLPTPTTAERVRVTITENFFGAYKPTHSTPVAGGDRVALGQVRFVGRLVESRLGTLGYPNPSLVSPAIDAGAASPTDPPTYDQRGVGFDRVVGGRIDIGAHESGAILDANAPPTVAIANQLTRLVEGPQPSPVKVADLQLGNFSNAPWSVELLGPDADRFFVPVDELGRSVREVWLRGGIELDHELLAAANNGDASLRLSVQVADPYRATGPAASVATPLADIVVEDVNDRPTLDAGASVPPITLASDVTPATNRGVAVASLLAGAADDDINPADELGIAIVGVSADSAPNSRVEHSLDDGATWFTTPGVQPGEVFLLPRDASLRFNKRDDFTGRLDNVVRFRVWDGTLGTPLTIAEAAEIDASLSATTDTLPDATASLSVVVTPRVGNPYSLGVKPSDPRTAVAFDPRGVGLHVWEGATDLMGRRVGAGGAAVGDPVTVAGVWASKPRVVAAPDGGFVVLWQEASLSGPRVLAKRFQLAAESTLTAGDPVELVAADGLAVASSAYGSDALVVAWIANGAGYIARWTLDEAGTLTPDQPAALVPATAGTSVSQVAAVPDADGQTIHLAWVEAAGGADPTVRVATHDESDFSSPVVLPSLTPPHPPGVNLSGPRSIEDLALAIGVGGEPVVGWRETVAWTSVDSESVVSTTAVAATPTAGADWDVVALGEAEERTGDGGPAGARIIGYTLRSDRHGRAGHAWTETYGPAADSTLLSTRWTETNDQLGPTYSQAVTGVWSNPELTTNGAGEFGLTATSSLAGFTDVVTQRFRLPSLNAATWDYTDGEFEVRGDGDETPLVVSTGDYGPDSYLTVNGELTEVPVSVVTSVAVVTGDAPDEIDTRGLSSLGIPVAIRSGGGDDRLYVGAGQTDADGGSGDDTYVVSSAESVNLRVVDEAGNDRLLLDEWGADRALVVLGYAGTQTVFDQSGRRIELHMTTGAELESVGSRIDGDDIEGSGGHVVYDPAAKRDLFGDGPITVSSAGVGAPNLNAADGELTLAEALLWAKTDEQTDRI
ncbi:MAG: choice-of-anchor Q domain-containing protein, partial [Planctomycetota bacterium]